MRPDERADAIRAYAGGYPALLEALRDLAPGELDWRFSPGAWTVREIVHHLEDAEMTGAVRLRRLLAEDEPALPAFDEEEYRRRLHYGARPIEPALAAVAAAHATTAELLERLGDAAWRRAGVHSADGPYSVERWLAFHGAHTHEHVAQIRQIRADFARWAAGQAPGSLPDHAGSRAPALR